MAARTTSADSKESRRVGPPGRPHPVLPWFMLGCLFAFGCSDVRRSKGDTGSGESVKDTSIKPQPSGPCPHWPPSNSNCCTVDPTRGGCDDEEISVCVVDANPACAESWTELCVDSADNYYCRPERDVDRGFCGGLLNHCIDESGASLPETCTCDVPCSKGTCPPWEFL
jgi:hypothetical protein